MVCWEAGFLFQDCDSACHFEEKAASLRSWSAPPTYILTQVYEINSRVDSFGTDGFQHDVLRCKTCGSRFVSWYIIHVALCFGWCSHPSLPFGKLQQAVPEAFRLWRGVQQSRHIALICLSLNQNILLNHVIISTSSHWLVHTTKFDSKAAESRQTDPEIQTLNCNVHKPKKNKQFRCTRKITDT